MLSLRSYHWRLPSIALPRRFPKSTTGRIVLGTYLAAFALLVLFVARFASRVPLNDEYNNFTHLFLDPPISEYWRQHNEHRIPLPRIVYVAAVKLSGYDFRAPMVVNIVLLTTVTVFLLAVVRRVRGKFAVSDAFIPIVVLGIDQWENLIWGFQVQFILSTTLVLTALGLAMHPGVGTSTRRLVFISSIAFLLPLCGANGIPFALTLGAWLLLVGARNLWVGLRAAGIVAVIGAVAAIAMVPLYFMGLQKVPGPERVLSAEQFAIGFTNLLGFGFGPASYLPHGEAVHGLTAVGVTTTIFFAFTGAVLTQLTVCDPEKRDRAFALGALLAGVIGLAVGVAYGRAAFPGATFAPRYVSLFMPGPVIAYCAWVIFGRGRLAVWIPGTLSVTAMIALVPNIWFTLGVAKFHSDRLKRAEFSVKSGLPVGIVADRHPWLCPGSPDARRHWLELLRSRGIAPFRNMLPDPPYLSEPVPLRVVHLEGLSDCNGEYHVTNHQGAIIFALPRPRHVHALRVIYTAGDTTGLQPRSVVSWDRGGHVPPSPGYGIIDIIDGYAKPTPTIVLIDREIDVLRIDLFGTGSKIHIYSLEILSKVE